VKFDKSSGAISSSNLEVLHEHIKAGVDHLTYQGLLCVIADACDLIARGNDLVIFIGTTRERDALLLTVKSEAGKARAGGASLAELSHDAERLV
jgi:hypothetical protein